MDIEARDEISAKLKVWPLRFDPADALPYSRPRFCWMSESPCASADTQLTWRKGFIEVFMYASGPGQAAWVRPGWTWGAENVSWFPTFMKAIRRVQPPPVPAGLRRTPHDARCRWESDSYRYPPYQYKREFMLQSGDQLRTLDSSEREILMGFGAGHTKFCMSASHAKQMGKQAVEDERCSLVGDSFSMLSFSWACMQMCRQFSPNMSVQQIVDRLGLAPGFSTASELTAPMSRYCTYHPSPNVSDACEPVLGMLVRGTNHTGSDVKISSGEIVNSSHVTRQSVNAVWFRWKQVLRCRWQAPQHINLLEMRALLLALQWRSRSKGCFGVRFVHLVDSFVSLAIVAKGRTSSLMLRRMSKQIAAYVLALSAQLVLGHVDSSENPADQGSRS